MRCILRQYQAGASLLAIAEDMTRQGIRYHQHTAAWNKNMVKRILENSKYIGADNWPRLVSDEDFTAAQRLRTERSTYAPLSTDIRPIQGKVVCGLCGGEDDPGQPLPRSGSLEMPKPGLRAEHLPQ